MKNEEQIIKDNFIHLLNTVPDNRNGVLPAINFFSSIARHRNCIPPTTELVTLFKKHKPILFHFMKSTVPSTSPIHFILQLEMSYEEALSRLDMTEETLVQP